MIDLEKTKFAGLYILKPKVFQDKRGSFLEAWNKSKYQDLGITNDFVQDNISYSQYGTLRGLHYQYPQMQAKLVMVLAGTVLDVVVDLRQGLPTFGQWQSFELSSTNHHQLYIPAGFAHGFVCLSEQVYFSYKCSAPYVKEDEICLLWNDPKLNIDWQLPTNQLIISEKDQAGLPLEAIPKHKIPTIQTA